MTSVAVIGAGAAGCFCSIEMARRHPDWHISVLEAGKRPLAKVAVTGGGRCNFTNTFEGVGRLEEAYPRGAQLMKRALKVFGQRDVMSWFAAAGVPCTVQPDNCVFPQSQDAMQIVRVLESHMHRRGVEVRTGVRVTAVKAAGGGFDVSSEGFPDERFDKVVVAAGGGAVGMLSGLGLEIVSPVPSLFTLKIDDASLKSLMGAVVEDAVLSLAGTKFRARGALLLTDWGVSGPATLKLSSYAARHLAGNGYSGILIVNWIGGGNEEDARAWIGGAVVENPRKLLLSVHPECLSSRVWKHILNRSGLRDDMRWSELGAKGVSRLACQFTADSYSITGRCRFKEEFVTAGGVSLSEVRLDTLESRRFPGLFFAGEVLDVDAVTGGFNLQAAWSSGYVVASSI